LSLLVAVVAVAAVNNRVQEEVAQVEFLLELD
jgi:hypothetical protein